MSEVFAVVKWMAALVAVCSVIVQVSAFFEARRRRRAERR
jgi:hypothetical protein